MTSHLVPGNIFFLINFYWKSCGLKGKERGGNEEEEKRIGRDERESEGRKGGRGKGRRGGNEEEEMRIGRKEGGKGEGKKRRE